MADRCGVRAKQRERIYPKLVGRVAQSRGQHYFAGDLNRLCKVVVSSCVAGFGEQDVEADSGGALAADGANEAGKLSSRPGPAAIVLEARVIDDDDCNGSRRWLVSAQPKKSISKPAAQLFNRVGETEDRNQAEQKQVQSQPIGGNTRPA
jgi:hypothetical protein